MTQPGRQTTRTVSIPSIVLPMLVFCVLTVSIGGGWSSWRWWHRDVERRLFLDLGDSPREVEDIKRYQVGQVILTTESATESSVDIDAEWNISLMRGEYDWYVFIDHMRCWTIPKKENYVAHVRVGWDLFRVSPLYNDYLPSESKEMSVSPFFEEVKCDWHYVMDFVCRLKANKSTSEFGSTWIHTSFTILKPDKRFDFGKLGE